MIANIIFNLNKKMLLRSRLLICLFGFLSPLAYANSIDGAALSLYWGTPFVLILLSIALLPIVLSKLWHHHYGKIIFILTLIFIGMFGWQFGCSSLTHLLCDVLIKEYIPFILILFALFTISGGILIDGNLQGTPKNNTILILIGTLLASIMGTTGAAMLMIRPLIRANQQRKHRAHIIIFFIFLVANIGGGLTPLGDPPLFIGFLNGVDFFWTIKQMVLPVCINTMLLLIVFYTIDRYYYRKDEPSLVPNLAHNLKITINGKFNIILLIAIIATILITGLWQSTITINILTTQVALHNLIRDAILIVIILLSLVTTTKTVRQDNQFSWQPIIEVAKLFIGIFITITPVIAILKAGKMGSLSGLISLVTHDDGSPINTMYFWLTGLLSGFLDNAPTYLVFFNLASGKADLLMNTLPTTLLAISMGSVFMGALTYIGNAPNLMIKSIANQSAIQMPSFFGYMVWSISLLIPLFWIDSMLFFNL